MAPTNSANVKQPFSTRAGDAILDARATIVKAVDSAKSNSDILPTVSIEVCTSHVSSNFAIATTRNPSNVTIPVMSNTLPITSG